MEHREDEILKALFQQEFETRREPVEEENWDLIAANLDKKRFYKFSFTRFNVFHLSFIILSSLLSLTTLIYWINAKGTVENSKSGNAIIKDTTSIVLIQDSMIKTENVILSPYNVIPKSPSSLRSVSSDSVGNSGKTINPTYSSSDSIFSSNTSPISAKDTTLTILPKEKPKTVVRKTVFKIKQDTLIKMDTVRTSDKKRKTK